LRGSARRLTPNQPTPMVCSSAGYDGAFRRIEGEVVNNGGPRIRLTSFGIGQLRFDKRSGVFVIFTCHC
jgi:hypothetical protein